MPSDPSQPGPKIVEPKGLCHSCERAEFSGEAEWCRIRLDVIRTMRRHGVHLSVGHCPAYIPTECPDEGMES